MTRPESPVEPIFFAALAKESPQQRAAYLDEACGGDQDLRQRVERLLKAHSKVGGFLEGALGLVPTVDEQPVREGPGTVIGAYKLLQQIGEGGMGTVFMAEQTQPVQRKVALKVIKPGMDSAQVIARFEAERQALALMDHVNIARVLDAGTTESGRPYFVMELIHGVPITRYCDDNQLTPRERLELFVPVCAAVQHAHQKGIIHRDLKPSNVLITLYDGKPVPKVIDFGVAKATEQRLTERTLFTQYGTMVGTLEYMSPEQAEMSPLGVDTRSDIYSLGVLLYELLTGSTPLNQKRVREAGYGEILRMIKEEEPPRPSTRLSESGEALAAISAQRHMEPARLAKLVKGELDWIVMKTLEKDRNRRYESANGFAADVGRYLNDEPVLACPPTAGYRFKKLMRRHKGPVLAAAVVAAALVMGIAGTLLGLARALASERDAVAARDEEVRQREEAVTQRDRALTAESAARANEARAKEEEHKAKQSAAEAQAVLGFFQDRVLAAARPQGQDGGLGIDATVRQAVDAAEPQIAPSFADQPTVEASVRNVLGLTYWYLGEAALAIRQFERSLELRRRVLGPDHPDSITSMNELGNAYRDDGKLGRALPLFEEALKRRTTLLGPDHPHTLIVLNNLGNAHWSAGRPDRAMPLHKEALKRRTAVLGPDHPHTLHSMHNLASAYQDLGMLDQALPLFEETVKRRKAKLGADHPNTLTSMNNLATGYWVAKKLDRSVPLFEETLKLQKAKLGPKHPRVLQTMFNLATNYLDAGRLKEAVPLFEEALNLQKAKLGPDHPDTLLTMNTLAFRYWRAGKLDLALPLFKEALELHKAKLGADHPDTLVTMNNLASGYRDSGKLDLALPLFQQAAAGMEKLQFMDQDAGSIVANLIACHERLKQYDKAETWRRKWLAVVKQRLGAESPAHAGELVALGMNLLEQKKFADAEPILRECLTIRAKKEPDAWTTFNTRSMLGGILLAQKKYADAEPLLRAGYDGMKEREAKIPPQGRARLSEAIQRLIDLNTAWDKPDQAAEWRKKLDASKQ